MLRSKVHQSVAADVRRLYLIFARRINEIWSLLGFGRQSGMGLPHSTTLARGSIVPRRPRGYGVRQPHAAFIAIAKIQAPPFIGLVLFRFRALIPLKLTFAKV